MSNLYIGSMSGTSCDGIDTVLVDFSFKIPRILGHVYSSYPEHVRSTLLNLITAQKASLATLGVLDTELGELYARDVLRVLEISQIKAHTVKAVGLHGQTIYHAPNLAHPFTWQMGNAHVVAALSQIPVVADFRGLDIALHGQGAPLAPIFHAALFGQLQDKVVVLNLGGIANISLIEKQKIIAAFDTGPANCLLDAWMMETQGLPYDDQGAFARQGSVIPELLASLLQEPYFHQLPPKSTGRELFNLNWLFPHLKKEYSAMDVAATLTELTAISIMNAIRLMHFVPDELIICGGGNKNVWLRESIERMAPCPKITSSVDYTFKPEHIEALAFAYLAKMFIEHQSLPLPIITGASCEHRCGVLYNFV